MKIPIPDDWDGESWFCSEIRWPNSPFWIAILTGFLSLPSYGYFWDEKTGTITDVQEIGRAIFARNFPYVPCCEDGGQQPDQPDSDLMQCLISAAMPQDWIQEMSLCGYNPKAFKIENGALWVRDFCGEWVKIGNLTVPNDGGTYDLPDDTDYDETDIYPCGMASAVAAIIIDLGGYIWDNADSTLPIFMVTKCQNHVDLDLNNTWVMDTVAQALIMKGSVIISGTIIDLERSDVIPTGLEDEIKCAILPVMQADGTVDKNKLYQMLEDFFTVRFPWGESGNNIYIQNYWDLVLQCFGEGNLRDVAVSGALDGTAECICEGDLEPTVPTTSGWYLGYAFETIEYTIGIDYNWTYARIYESIPHDVYGVQFRMNYISGGAKATFKPCNDSGGSGLTYDVMLNGSNSANLALDTQYIACGPLAYAELYPSGGPTRTTDGITISDVVASPVALKEQIVLYMMSCMALDTEAVWNRFQWRWLHNINSPSHQ